MAVNLGLAKLCVCAVAGAVVGGSAVHMVEKPRKKPRINYTRTVPKPEMPSLPCEPMMVQSPLVHATFPGGDALRTAAMPALPPVTGGATSPATSPAASEPVDVPEPGSLAILGAGGLLALVARRFRRR